MRTQPNAELADRCRHGVEIALEGVEVDDQRRRIDLGQRRADLGGWKGHRKPVDWIRVRAPNVRQPFYGNKCRRTSGGAFDARGRRRGWPPAPFRATFSRKEEGAASDAAETYSAVCFLNPATSFAVSFEPFAPNRAVT